MAMLEEIFSWLLAVFIMSMPAVWVWMLYYKIRCRKVDSCMDRKCKYWEWCSHNYAERKKDEIGLRKQNLMRRYGSTKENLNEKTED